MSGLNWAGRILLCCKITVGNYIREAERIIRPKQVDKSVILLKVRSFFQNQEHKHLMSLS